MKKFTFLLASLATISFGSAQTINTIAGNGTAAYAGDGGQATAAELNQPYGVAVDDTGNVYIGEWNSGVVRKVEHGTGIITTYAGTGTSGYGGDGGQATAAQLGAAAGLFLDDSANLYIGDFTNNRVREVYAKSRVIVTVAGNGTAGFTGNGGPATAAEIHSPYGVYVNTAGDIYFADEYNMMIRKVTRSTGFISTVAGTGGSGYNGDAILATAAELYYPLGVYIDKPGNIYISDQFNERIRKVNTHDSIFTIAGNGTSGYSGDGGQATAAELHYPYAVNFDSLGNMYIADTYNSVVRMVNMSSGKISTMAGNNIAGFSGDGGPATAAEIYYPSGIAFDKAYNLYIADRGNNRTREITSLVLTAVNEMIAPGELRVYPNPAGSNVYALLDNAKGNVSISLYNVMGQEIMKQTVMAQPTINLSVANVPAGLYILRAQTEDGNTLVNKIEIAR